MGSVKTRMWLWLILVVKMLGKLVKQMFQWVNSGQVAFLSTLFNNTAAMLTAQVPRDQ